MAQIKTNAQVALECATKFCVASTYASESSLVNMADRLLTWLDENSGTVDLSK